MTLFQNFSIISMTNSMAMVETKIIKTPNHMGQKHYVTKPSLAYHSLFYSNLAYF